MKKRNSYIVSIVLTLVFVTGTAYAIVSDVPAKPDGQESNGP